MDGTNNTPSRQKETNVSRLYRAARDSSGNKKTKQTVRYILGVGTERRNGGQRYYKDLIKQTKPTDELINLAPSVVKRYLKAINPDLPVLLRFIPNHLRNKFLGGLCGWGTSFNIKAAYAFLCSNYQRRRQDNIYLFGFSRGAFAARSLAGFVDRVGILLRDKIYLVEAAYALYKHPDEELREYLSEFLMKVSGSSRVIEGRTDLPVHFLGVWDTVARVGIPKYEQDLPWMTSQVEFHEMELPPSIGLARHALALHELREPFRPTMWSAINNQPEGRIKQVWFPGAHADVGGGYGQSERGLENNSLRWMAHEASAAGLHICEQRLSESLRFSRSKVHHEFDSSENKIYRYLVPTIRDELQSFQNAPEALINSYQIDESAIQRLLEENPPVYEGSRYQSSVIDKFHEIDEIALRFYFCLFQNKHLCKDCDLALIEKDWWKSISLNEFRNANLVATEFLDRQEIPTATELKSLTRALCILAGVNRLAEALGKLCALHACILSEQSPKHGLRKLVNIGRLVINDAYEVDWEECALSMLEQYEKEGIPKISRDRLEAMVNALAIVAKIVPSPLRNQLDYLVLSASLHTKENDPPVPLPEMDLESDHGYRINFRKLSTVLKA